MHDRSFSNPEKRKELQTSYEKPWPKLVTTAVEEVGKQRPDATERRFHAVSYRYREMSGRKAGSVGVGGETTHNKPIDRLAHWELHQNKEAKNKITFTGVPPNRHQ